MEAARLNGFMGIASWKNCWATNQALPAFVCLAQWQRDIFCEKNRKSCLFTCLSLWRLLEGMQLTDAFHGVCQLSTFHLPCGILKNHESSFMCMAWWLQVTFLVSRLLSDVQLFITLKVIEGDVIDGCISWCMSAFQFHNLLEFERAKRWKKSTMATDQAVFFLEHNPKRHFYELVHFLCYVQ